MKPVPAPYQIEIVGASNVDFMVFCPGQKQLRVTNQSIHVNDAYGAPLGKQMEHRRSYFRISTISWM